MKPRYRIASQLDFAENAALLSRRWREARQRFLDELGVQPRRPGASTPGRLGRDQHAQCVIVS
jgi:hypothetical protein